MTRRMTQWRGASLATFLAFFLTLYSMLLGTALAASPDIKRTEEGYPYIDGYEGYISLSRVGGSGLLHFMNGELYVSRESKLQWFSRDLKLLGSVNLEKDPMDRLMGHSFSYATWRGHSLSHTIWRDQILVTQRGGVQFFDKNLEKTRFMKFEKFMNRSLFEDYQDRPEYNYERRYASIQAIGDTLVVEGRSDINDMNCIQAEGYDLETGELLWRIHNEICREFPEDSHIHKLVYDTRTFENYIVAFSSFYIPSDSDPKKTKKVYGYVLYDPKTMETLSTAFSLQQKKYVYGQRPEGNLQITYANHFKDRGWFERYVRKDERWGKSIPSYAYDPYTYDNYRHNTYAYDRCTTLARIYSWGKKELQLHGVVYEGDFHSNKEWIREVIQWGKEQYKLGRKRCSSFEIYVVTSLKIIRLRR